MVNQFTDQLIFGNILVIELSYVVVMKVKKALEARGSKTIRALGRTFRLLDSYDRNRKVDKDEFFVGLQENGVKLDRNEANVFLCCVNSGINGIV